MSPGVVLNFGKHKGRRLGDVPLSYLDWLEREAGLQPWLRRAVRTELERRDGPGPIVAPARQVTADTGDLPLGEPGVYAGVMLNPIHAGTFRDAVRRGVFYAEPSEPLSSPALESWRRWHRMAGREAPVVTITWKEWAAGARPPDEAEDAPF